MEGFEPTNFQLRSRDVHRLIITCFWIRWIQWDTPITRTTFYILVSKHIVLSTVSWYTTYEFTRIQVSSKYSMNRLPCLFRQIVFETTAYYRNRISITFFLRMNFFHTSQIATFLLSSFEVQINVALFWACLPLDGYNFFKKCDFPRSKNSSLWAWVEKMSPFHRERERGREQEIQLWFHPFVIR